MSRPRPTPTRRRRPWLAVVSMVAVVGGLLVVSSSPGAAQSTFVGANVRINPSLPNPGDDVSVTVRVTGCPPGDTDVEVLLAADLPGGVAGTLMADAPARTSLLWRTRAHLQLRDAVQGWYGIRVQCGSYNPGPAPMPNTTFAVGANPTATAALASRTVVLGGTVGLHGDQCPGKSVDYEIIERSHNNDAFLPTASIPTAADGTWSAQIPLGVPFTPGPVLVRTRCVEVNQLGTTVYSSYGNPLELRIEPPS